MVETIKKKILTDPPPLSFQRVASLCTFWSLVARASDHCSQSLATEVTFVPCPCHKGGAEAGWTWEVLER